MSEFFTKFPKIQYGSYNATDILARVALREKYTNKVQLFYEYNLQEGDTPEIVAAKFYGDPERNWIILFMNEIINPYFDFPLSTNNFLVYLDAKYATEGALINRSGSEYAKMIVNPDPLGYVVDITTTDQNSGVTTINTIYIDEKAYGEQYLPINSPFNFINQPNSSIQYTKRMISVYDYENIKNEDRRKIKLLQPQYVQQVEKELSSLMQTPR